MKTYCYLIKDILPTQILIYCKSFQISKHIFLFYVHTLKISSKEKLFQEIILLSSREPLSNESFHENSLKIVYETNKKTSLMLIILCNIDKQFVVAKEYL